MTATDAVWIRTAPEIEMTVDCGGAPHVLRWSGGGLVLADHPELDAELALVAFGGAEPRCLGLLRLWNEAVADGGFLAEWVDENHLNRARLSWLTMALERLRNEGLHEFLRDLSPTRAERMGRFVLSFPRPFVDRAAGAVAEAVTEGDGVACRGAPALVPAAIAGRLRRAFVAAVGGRQLAVGAAALVPLRITVVPGEPGVAGALTGDERGVDLVVSPTWLHRVWAAGAAVIGGHLVLRLGPAGGPGEAVAGARSSTAATAATAATADLVVWDSDRARPRIERRPVVGDRDGWRLGPRPTASGPDGAR
ncbi:MAG: hypothetical protein ACFCVK_22435 [Acidimicrobiales bacterium]